MTELEYLPFDQPEPDPTAVEREPRRCRRHEWLRFPEGDRCVQCNAVRDEAASRRGRSSLRAGKDAERAIAKAYNGTRTGHFGGPDDVLVGELFTVQSKAGGWFSNRYWDELAKLPRTGGRIPTLIVSDRPGPGHRTRRYVVRTLEDDLDLHGRISDSAPGGTDAR